MSHLFIPFLSRVEQHMRLQDVLNLLDNQKKHHINIAPWPAYPYQPAVSFTMAYGPDSMVLQYDVTEKEVKAVYNQSNDPVYKDSCVEFFISFDEKGYYNFEFNCLGTCLAAFGPNRHERTFLPSDIIRKIKSLSFIYQSENRNRVMSWQLTVMLPFDIFVHHSFTDLKNKSARANFYKCGDDLVQPHYLCWNPIQSPLPDFHLPQFFGTIQFG